MMPCNHNHLTRDMRLMVLITIILYTCTSYNYNQFQGRHQQVISRVELARISNLRNWNWNWNWNLWNWNWNLLQVVELELELKIKELELELNWKNGIDPNPGASDVPCAQGCGGPASCRCSGWSGGVLCTNKTGLGDSIFGLQWFHYFFNW